MAGVADTMRTILWINMQRIQRYMWQALMWVHMCGGSFEVRGPSGRGITKRKRHGVEFVENLGVYLKLYLFGILMFNIRLVGSIQIEIARLLTIGGYWLMYQLIEGKYRESLSDDRQQILICKANAYDILYRNYFR